MYNFGRLDFPNQHVSYAEKQEVDWYAKDYASKSTTINNGMKVIVNAVQTEAMKYTYSTIAASKTTVESNLLATLQDTFQTECITSVIVSVVVQ